MIWRLLESEKNRMVQVALFLQLFFCFCVDAFFRNALFSEYSLPDALSFPAFIS